MPNTWFTSDTHFSHASMAARRGYAPPGTPRGEVTAEQVAAHDEAIIAAWNRRVRPEDTVWHLGDLAVVPPRRVAHLVSRLRGRKRLVVGNHDQAHPAFGERSIQATRECLEAGFEWVGPVASVKVPAPPRPGENPPKSPAVMLSHFPYLGDHTDTPREMQWRLRDEGAPLIHGHLHSEVAMTSVREVHVGWDTWHRPVSIHEIGALLAVFRQNVREGTDSQGRCPA